MAKPQHSHLPKFVQDLTGRRFGRLVVVQFDSIDKKQAQWFCRCDCGGTKIVKARYLKHKKTGSCGCSLLSENRSLIKQKHCHEIRAYIYEYRSWIGMIYRCDVESGTAYDDYGGRGISVCERWLKGDSTGSGFDCFLVDMGLRPTAKHSLDRIDVNGNYEPSNCRWATDKQQMTNQRRNVFIEIGGQRKTISQWAEVAGVSYSCISKRYYNGCPIERLLLPPHKGKK